MKKIILMILLIAFQGCMYYYKVQTVKPVDANSIKKYDSLNKYLLIHQGDSAWHLSKPTITNNSLLGELSVLPDNRLIYKTTDPNRKPRYKRENRLNVLDQVHLYLHDTLYPKLYVGDNVKIALSAIQKAEIYKKAKGKTTWSWLLVPLGIPSTIICILLIAAAISPP